MFSFLKFPRSPKETFPWTAGGSQFPPPASREWIPRQTQPGQDDRTLDTAQSVPEKPGRTETAARDRLPTGAGCPGGSARDCGVENRVIRRMSYFSPQVGHVRNREGGRSNGVTRVPGGLPPRGATLPDRTGPVDAGGKAGFQSHCCPAGPVALGAGHAPLRRQPSPTAGFDQLRETFALAIP